MAGISYNLSFHQESEYCVNLKTKHAEITNEVIMHISNVQ